MMARRYVVTGRFGQVAQSLIERAERHGEIEIIPLARPNLDLADIGTIEKALVDARPELIISAAAYTAVDQAESDAAKAFLVNSAAIDEIGRVATKLNVPIIHLSTDYVFDGSKTSPYHESDPVAPLNVYGQSKLEGERRLVASGADYVILRTAWVYSPFNRNFLRTMLQLAGSRDELDVVADQYGNPTSALDIADAILAVADNLLSSRDQRLRGIFHMAGSGEASWADFASEIFRISVEMGGPSAIVHPIPTAQYPTPARRPNNSRLDCSKLERVHGVRLPNWKIATATTLQRLLACDAPEKQAGMEKASEESCR
ncbi:MULTISPECIES: dTDP-4-dehydrorhamnose reductase [unclassified Neorhizobium]|uniref:dTDP-4-dehydrorhamnose reductase n=2 Tax=unclassified Neorhizobium TaxID=2629175 RepID=UPI001FF65926|nr:MULTISPECIES: dTDP-4-dehydrorhamnose reductase [unclassified Neorhizobium]MCJ9668642.1 dTDP-4-dehydrorhamnose reductase [Neorhizobium sp. SHOUNA12B]MCJ9743906.1 dTDP-4-dehydrorhamnose reductase [Neorhizobium sp. SHOUNA12A]